MEMTVSSSISPALFFISKIFLVASLIVMSLESNINPTNSIHCVGIIIDFSGWTVKPYESAKSNVHPSKVSLCNKLSSM